MSWLALTLITALCETGRDLVGKKGVQHVDPLVVAVLFSVTSTFDKVGVRAWAPLPWVAAIHAFGALGLAPLIVRRRVVWSPRLLVLGLLSAAGNVTQMFALRLTVAAYVIAVKR